METQSAGKNPLECSPIQVPRAAVQAALHAIGHVPAPALPDAAREGARPPVAASEGPSTFETRSASTVRDAALRAARSPAVEIIARLSSERTRLKSDLENVLRQREEIREQAKKEILELRAALAARRAPEPPAARNDEQLEKAEAENALLASKGVELLAARDAAHQELALLRSQLEKAGEQLARQRSELAAAESQREDAARREAELAMKAKELVAHAKEIARKQDDLSRQRLELEPRAELRDELIRLRLRVAELEHESGRAAALEERLADTVAPLAELEALRRALAQSTREKDALASAFADSERTKKELESAKAALAESERAKKDLEGVKAALEEAERERQARAILEAEASPARAVKADRSLRFVAIGFGAGSEPLERPSSVHRVEETTPRARPYPSLAPAPHRAQARMARMLSRVDRKLSRIEKARLAQTKAREAELLERLEAALAELGKQTEAVKNAASRPVAQRVFTPSSEAASSAPARAQAPRTDNRAPRPSGPPAVGGFLANLISANLELQKGARAVPRPANRSTNATRSTEL